MAILSPNEISAFQVMSNAVETLRTRYNTPRYAKDRADEFRDFAKLITSGLSILMEEAGGDAKHLCVQAVLSDITDCMEKVIEAEEGRDVPDFRRRLARHYGTYHVSNGRVA